MRSEAKIWHGEGWAKFPTDGDNVPFGCWWVRKAVFISFLDDLGGRNRYARFRVPVGYHAIADVTHFWG